MKIIITGSHFTPAQAVIKELLSRDNFEVVYIGRNRTMEGDPTPSVESGVIPKLGIKFINLNTGRWQRHFTRFSILSILKIPWGFLEAFLILLREKPDLVVSFGGYIGVPVVIAAWLLSIPIIVHEQTLVSGIANTVSSWFATKIAVSFDNPYDFPRNKILVTGNPLRAEILTSTTKPSIRIANFFEQAKRHNTPVLFVTGGNQGSHAINSSIFEKLASLTKDFFVIHQTGDSKYHDFSIAENLAKDNDRYLVSRFFEAMDMGYILKHASLGISRAGINTLLEIAWVGLPTLIIPLPSANKDEQKVNARFFESKGAGEVLEEKDLSGKSLNEKIIEMKNNLPMLAEKASSAKSVVLENAEKRLIQEIYILVS
ncbi:hypothetical protein A2631_02595 [Candidatus Daviesbacteria bacterium RIFCSPHIGHO2_01_FULL_44_29]|uniref:UDP-N-acetylglucosamine--N-acetylmuramyl-(pentapeptide) pyrophosphoryl-undecaprenol N-acetylglucosamine transferase n=1 Tax=Candidatus Daviesbacteria bacterium RIFCSPHIGHO2_02_FULL_43_12 TaxID=1797776 RepID=A0A1F5KK18_9BACT|nr:MAG: hypothetical protein A2631_02595 [Candidatus Daviesbacteria bacterium RIFCSPHIGHO2_01_FULL_44_29]OGE41273.1 MAG: hypothetical protein A3D25_01990 [Candidatus Daviesbacteria bacterium RIFCSPHIGHO2_02_FULL_43_12]OGE69474.1 MAG: hypothetical protein A3B55_03730 [Candidatus Daviesbacteria bacterium RIFCSPLOWO2_01_FULL_43_15]